MSDLTPPGTCTFERRLPTFTPVEWPRRSGTTVLAPARADGISSATPPPARSARLILIRLPSNDLWPPTRAGVVPPSRPAGRTVLSRGPQQRKLFCCPPAVHLPQKLINLIEIINMQRPESSRRSGRRRRCLAPGCGH